MNFLQYSLTALVAYFGLGVGLIIMKTSKEEQKAGKKYFIILQKIVLLLIIAALFYFLKINLVISIIVLFIILAVLINNYKNKKSAESYAVYPLLGVLFYFSSDNPTLLLTESLLIFIYGLVTSSLLTNFKKKNYVEIMLKHASFLIIALLSFLIAF